jgi:ATP-dependent exoDNAse (exonuclease V) beta subunit
VTETGQPSSPARAASVDSIGEDLRAQDAAARETALDPARSFIVQAPAGSGKTGLLTQRYLALLARVEHPEEIVAITFTNKAAAEMRDRILKALESGRSPSPPMDPRKHPHEHRTWTLARAAVARDSGLGWDIGRNPGRLRIRTIDALNASLARALPLTASFGAAPSVVEDAGALYEEAAHATIALLETGEAWSPAVERLLRHLDNDLPRMAALLARMLARRDQWLRHVARTSHNEQLPREALEDALRHVIGDALADVTAAVPAWVRDELPGCADYAAACLGQTSSNSPIIACAGLAALPEPTLTDLDRWLGLATLLLNKEGHWRRQVNKNIGFPAASGSAAEKQRRKEAKERFERLLDRIAVEEEFRLRLHELRMLPKAAYGDEQWALLEALTVLLPLAAAQLTMVFRRRGQVDFVAVAHGALKALGTPEEPTELLLSLDYRIQHILVDEFQDTSLSQYELLERLTAGWQPGDGRTLFAVGDPMQSIYRFREAEVGLFLRARREGIGVVPLTPLVLAVNFRSQTLLVDWVNATFSQVLPAVENVTFGAVPYAPAIAHRPALDGPAVMVHPLLDRDSSFEAEQVVALVREARAADPKATIAILARARSHLADILPRLRRAGIRFHALDIEPLGHRPVVQDLFALTRALAHPADRVAWLAVLRAPWCGLTLADLHALCANDLGVTIWDSINDPERRASLSPEGRERLARVTAVLGACLAQRERRGLRRHVEGAWLALGGPACVTDAADLEDAEAFLSLLEELESGGELPDLAMLEERLEDLYARPHAPAEGAAPEDAVQIMTIHKAKGLEFDTVIVPGLGRAPRRQDKELLRWAERPRAHGESDLLLAPIAGGTDHDPIYEYLRRLDGERGHYEDGRLLYVAATRARQRLHLLGHAIRQPEDADTPVREPAAGTLLRLLWPVVRDTFERAALASHGEIVAAAPVNPYDSPQVQFIERLPADWQLPAPPPSVRAPSAPEAVAVAVEFDWAGETARHIGTVVHRWLLRITREGAASWNAARVDALEGAFAAALADLGVAREEQGAAASRVAQALKNTLADARGRWLLENGHAEARSEYALSGLHGDRLVNVVLDRTFVDEQGRRWIVDYKTGVHTGADREAFLDREVERYRAQLERYAALMRELDDRPVRLGLYFPLMQDWREWSV